MAMSPHERMVQLVSNAIYEMRKEHYKLDNLEDGQIAKELLRRFKIETNGRDRVGRKIE